MGVGGGGRGFSARACRARVGFTARGFRAVGSLSRLRVCRVFKRSWSFGLSSREDSWFSARGFCELGFRV